MHSTKTQPTTTNRRYNMTTQTTTTNKHFYLRRGAQATDRMTADIELIGIKARLFINADKTCDVYKVLKNKKLGSKPIAIGRFEKHPLAGRDKMPDIRGIVTTSKGSKIAFVGWVHDADFDPYYVIQVDEFVRAGRFISF